MWVGGSNGADILLRACRSLPLPFPHALQVLKRRQLRALGWKVLSIPYWEWDMAVIYSVTTPAAAYSRRSSGGSSRNLDAGRGMQGRQWDGDEAAVEAAALRYMRSKLEHMLWMEKGENERCG